MTGLATLDGSVAGRLTGRILVGTEGRCHTDDNECANVTQVFDTPALYVISGWEQETRERQTNSSALIRGSRQIGIISGLTDSVTALHQQNAECG